MASATGRRSDKPEVGGRPGKTCGPLKSASAPCQPEGKLQRHGISPRYFRLPFTRDILCTAKPEPGDCANASTTRPTLPGRKKSSASKRQMISPLLLLKAVFKASDWPPFDCCATLIRESRLS